MLAMFSAVAVSLKKKSYIAHTVLTLTGGGAGQMVLWAVATPLVFGLEWLGIQILERTATFG